MALGATLALVLITNAFAFSATSMASARVVLFLALAVALGFALVIPLLHLNRRRAATAPKLSFPNFEERLLTYVERSESERSHARPAGHGYAWIRRAQSASRNAWLRPNRFLRSRPPREPPARCCCG